MKEFRKYKRGGLIYVPHTVHIEPEEVVARETKNPVYTWERGKTEELTFEPVVRDGVVLGKLFVSK